MDRVDTLQLRQVLVGADCTLSRVEIAATLGEFDPNVETFKVRPAFRSFRVVRNQNEGLWR